MKNTALGFRSKENSVKERHKLNMKILVFSDAHGQTRGMEQAICAHERDTDAILFLGDGMREAELLLQRFPQIMHTAVPGNNDIGYGGVQDCILDLQGVRTLCTHGHKYGVKGGRGRLYQAALEKEVQLVLFGHTHVAEECIMDGIRFFNPGSIGRGIERTYGVLYIENGKIVSGFGKI